MHDRLQYAPCGYIAVTREGLIADINHTLLDQIGYSLEDVLHMHVESLLSTSNKLIFHTYFYPFINLYGRVVELYIRLNHQEGHAIPYLLNARKLEVDGVEWIDCILVQMTKRIEYEMELKQMKSAIEQKQEELLVLNASLIELSNTDKLTGLKNRRYFQEQLNQHLHLDATTQEDISVLMIDIDHFKRVNDTYGHQIGDFVLEKLAMLLKLNTRQEDIVARYGGEEFIMLNPNMGIEESKAVAEHLRLLVEQSSWETGELTVRMSVSIGIATYQVGETDVKLIERADHALYHSKRQGRNRVTHCSEMESSTTNQ